MPKQGFQINPIDFLADSNYLLMDWDARGMYVYLMCIARQQKPTGTLPDNDEMLCKWLSITKMDDWRNRLKPQIFQGWRKEGERWVLDGIVR